MCVLEDRGDGSTTSAGERAAGHNGPQSALAGASDGDEGRDDRRAGAEGDVR